MALNKHLVQVVLFGMMMLHSLAGVAAPLPEWKIVPEESILTFTGTQNNSPVTGQFKTFSGDIKGDPEHLDSSSARIIIDMNSITTSYKDISDTLKTADWFDVKTFPQAIFTANQIAKTGNKTYEVKGTMTIRDITKPIAINLTVEEYSRTKAKVKGIAMLKRTEFGVGKGEWGDLSEIKDEVQVDFIITAITK